jgi:hypothetical protein
VELSEVVIDTKSDLETIDNGCIKAKLVGLPPSPVNRKLRKQAPTFSFENHLNVC